MRIGIVGRFKPPHIGSSAVLKLLSERADIFQIAIGSSNKYDERNPFTITETMKMIEIVLEGKRGYHVHLVPDYGDGNLWAMDVADTLGELDYFVSGNDYVIDLLKDKYYKILHTSAISGLPKYDIRSTEIRISMARGDGRWQYLVIPSIRDYIMMNHLDERFVDEFGKKTLEIASTNLWKDQSAEAERGHTKI